MHDFVKSRKNVGCRGGIVFFFIKKDGMGVKLRQRGGRFLGHYEALAQGEECFHILRIECSD